MAFNSLAYLLFLPVAYLCFYFTADRWRWLVLLGSSYGFYAALKAPYLLAVLLMVTSVSYYCGLRMAAHHNDAFRKRWLWTGSLACVAILALLKYFPFLEPLTNSMFGLNSALSRTLISIGVSYYAFQAISYLADIYLEIAEPEKHFGYYSLYLALFPKLLQGPIERAATLLPQLKQPYKFDYDVMRSGILLFAWGLFKKVVVADRLALYADQVFNNVHDYTGLALIIGTCAYSLQIYFDFAGYTDMARGAGRMFGLKLSENFNSPYLATSIADFWRRWHITFSRWILDYIFKPLQIGWRNWGQAGTALALLITFLVSGIWHGASWGFVIWGLLHGSYLAASTYYRPYQKMLYKRFNLDQRSWVKVWQVFAVFSMVNLAWIFFRAASLGDAWYIVRNALNFNASFELLQKLGLRLFIISNILFNNGKNNLLIIVVALFVIFLTYRFKHISIFDKSVWVRWSVYYFLALAILFAGAFNSDTQFIYVQF